MSGLVSLTRLGDAVLRAQGQRLRFHPGMALLRIKRLMKGELDPLVVAADIRPGESVLDCTLGLAGDALVLAHAIGETGHVLGLEGSPLLAEFAQKGLPSLLPPAAAPAQRIEVRAIDHRAFLATAAPRSFDVVYFDPMFRHARDAAHGFDVLRALADPRPLDLPTLEAAKRVARRAVVVKDGAPGIDLVRLGLRPLPSRRGANLLYARIDLA